MGSLIFMTPSECFVGARAEPELSLEEMAELCRDEESSGCDPEMLEKVTEGDYGVLKAFHYCLHYCRAFPSAADPEMLEALYVQARDRLLQEGIEVHERI